MIKLHGAGTASVACCVACRRFKLVVARTKRVLVPAFLSACSFMSLQCQQASLLRAVRLQGSGVAAGALAGVLRPLPGSPG